MERFRKWWFVLACVLAPLVVPAASQIIGGLPFTLTNGTVADATQVMADFNQIVNNTNANAAKNGVNADITALSALSTPLTNVQGGTTLFTSASTATGTANAQVVATPVPTGLALTSRPTLYFLPVATNTAATTLNANGTGAINVFKPSFSGPVALTGGEIIINQLAQVSYDGTRWLLTADTPAFGVATNLASAGTTDLGTVASHLVQITGTTGITAFGSTASVDVPVYKLRFSGALTMTHNATSLILPNAINKTTAANDTATALYLGSGNWQIIQYQSAALPAVTVQKFTSGTAQTYTATNNTVRQRVRIAGPGGGGAAQATNAGANGSANTSFQVNGAGTAWTAVLGQGAPVGGANTGGGVGGTGGTDGSTGTLIARFSGGAGSGIGNSGAGTVSGGPAGVSVFGGAGTVKGNTAGANAATNSGSGGSGAGSAGGTGGGGGGAGEYVEFWVTGMTTATYTGGLGGAGGAAGTLAGGNGAAGIIIIEEFAYKYARSTCEEPANDNYQFELCKAA
jgi:hypothetical protein